MIEGGIIHPELLKILASVGHGANILVADGHYPFSTGGGREVPRVYLNFAPGLLSVPDVLKHLVKVISIEAAAAVVHDDGKEPVIWQEYKEILPKGIEIRKLTRFEFYDAVNTPNTALIIATGEKRTHACIILTVGVRKL